MSSDIFKQILQDHQELSSLPQTLSEVLRTVRDDKGSAQDLAAVLEKDPGLATKVLRAANSPYYNGGREITSVRQAVMTLGMRAVSALALSTSVYDISGRWQSSVDRVRFWRHSLEVALIARALAETVGYAYPDEVFVGGLLHDIGILVLEKSFPDKFERIWRRVEAGDRMSDLEEDVWGTNHARVGQFLLEQWRIPATISEIVGNHHNYMLSDTDDSELRAAQIVALANLLSRFTLVRTRPETAIEIEHQDSLRQSLGVTPDQVRELLESMLTRVTEEAGFLEMEIGSPQDILIEANRMIYDHYCAAESLLRENRSMQKEIARAQMEKAALESLKTIAATFNHYINNAAATILGRAQLIQVKLEREEIADPKGEAGQAMNLIIGGVDTICAVVKELKQLTAFETTVYHDDTYILDIENKLKERLESLRAEETVGAR